MKSYIIEKSKMNEILNENILIFPQEKINITD